MPKTEAQERIVLAADLGGTKMIVALISTNGQVIVEERLLTLANEGPQTVIDRLLATIDSILSRKDMKPAQLESISIAAAGGIDSCKGVVTMSPNLPGWNNIPLRDIVQEKYRISTYIVNDASAAALGEHRSGAGRGTSNLIYVTISTGIGGGIIINDRLYLGTSGTAGEIGHMTIDVNGPRCACGNTGCLEMLASGTAMAKEAVKRINGGEKSALVEMVKGKLADITAEKIGIAAREGDPLSQAVISRAAMYLGVGMVNLVNLFNPDMIVIGGGVAKLGDILLNPARQAVQERAFLLASQAVRIETAQLGDEAGVYGAAYFALEQQRSPT